MRSESINTDVVLLDKIKALCRASSQCQSVGGDESLICGLLLWSRIANEDCFLQASRLGGIDGNTGLLVQFSLNLLRRGVNLETHKDEKDDEDRLSGEKSNKMVLHLLVRLALQLFTRAMHIDCKNGALFASVVEQATSYSLTILKERCCSVWLPMEPIDVELLNLITQSGFWCTHEAALCQLWKIYEDSMKKQRKAIPSQPKNDTENLVSPSEEQLMRDTLQSLLDQSSSCPTESEEIDRIWHETVLNIFEEHTLKSSEFPRFWEPALTWCLRILKEKETDPVHMHQRRIRWVWLLLNVLFTFKDHPIHASADQKWEEVLQLLLASAVATSDDITTLRPLTWAVSCREWPFMLQRFGLNRQLCTLLRLAVGEWKIQIENMIRTRSPEHAEVTTDACIENDQNPTMTMIRACGQMITDTVVWISDVDQHLYTADGGITSSEKTRKNITQFSIKSITQSLELALDICVQFLQDVHFCIGVLTDITEVVLGVLGSLLTEFDVFSGYEINKSHEEERSKSLTWALGTAIKLSQNNTRSSWALFPAVTTVFASAQGDKNRSSSIEHLASMVTAMVDGYWDHDARDDELVVWVCPLMELIFDMFPTKVSVEAWKSVLIRFLTHKSGKEIPTCSMEAVVGCFVSLQGDDPPPDDASAVIKQILSQTNP